MSFHRNAFLTIKDDGEVNWAGTEHGAANVHHVFNRDGKMIVAVKIAGGTHWTGRGMARGYSGARIWFFEMVSAMGGNRYKTLHLFDIPVRSERTPEEMVGNIRAEMGS